MFDRLVLVFHALRTRYAIGISFSYQDISVNIREFGEAVVHLCDGFESQREVVGKRLLLIIQFVDLAALLSLYLLEVVLFCLAFYQVFKCTHVKFVTKVYQTFVNVKSGLFKLLQYELIFTSANQSDLLVH